MWRNVIVTLHWKYCLTKFFNFAFTGISGLTPNFTCIMNHHLHFVLFLKNEKIFLRKYWYQRTSLFENYWMGTKPALRVVLHLKKNSYQTNYITFLNIKISLNNKIHFSHFFKYFQICVISHGMELLLRVHKQNYTLNLTIKFNIKSAHGPTIKNSEHFS